MLGSRIAPLLCLFFGTLAWAADWPQWRGPNRDGISSETGLLEAWPKGGPPLVWKIQGLGEGYSSAAIAGGRLFIQGQHGDDEYVLAFDAMLVCLETATGKRIWGFNIVDHFHGRVPQWGISESPLVDGDRVIVTPGGPGAAVVALDKMSGKLLWQSQSDSAGYSSPMVYDAGGSRRVVVFTADAAMGLDLASGRLQWRYERVANGTAT